jgi:hypothetical protein
VCFSECVGIRQVMSACLDVWDADKCCVFVWMCGTQASAVCLLCLFTVSVPSPGCLGLGQVLFVCLDVWDSSKSCVFVLFIYCICSIHCMCGTRKSAVFFWMCGIQTSAVCLSACVGLR